MAREFTPRRVDGLLMKMHDICVGLLQGLAAPLADGETVDLHRRFAIPFTSHTISELLGIPESDRDWMSELGGDIVAGITAAATRGSEELVARADEQTRVLERYLGDLAADRRKSPRDDLITALLSVKDEDRLDDEERFALLWVLWMAGFDSTAIAMDNGVWTLLTQPQHASPLSSSHADALTYADEVLRMVGPGIFAPTTRILTRDLELSGVELAAGAEVRPMYAAANRDPEVFADPDRFDVSRDFGRVLAFGDGIHHCLGSFLARAELAIGLAHLHERFPRLTNVTEPVWTGMFVRPEGRSLPVALPSP